MSLNFKVLQQAISLHFTVVVYISTMSCTFTNLCVPSCVCIVLYGNPMEFKILHNAKNLILQCGTYNYYNVNEVLVVLLRLRVCYFLFFANFARALLHA